MKGTCAPQVIPAAWLRLFSPSELNQLLGGGDSKGLDIADLEAHTTYSNGYTCTSPAVQAFWKASEAILSLPYMSCTAC